MHDTNQVIEIYTAHQVADYIKRSYKTTLKLIKERKIKVIDDGTRGYRISKIELFKYLGHIVEEEKPEINHSKKKKRKSYL